MYHRSITDWRIHRGITQAELAKQIGMQPSQLSRMLNSKRRPQLTDVTAIAKVLRISVADALIAFDLDPATGGQASAPLKGVIDADGIVRHDLPAGMPAHMGTPAGLAADACALRYVTEDYREGWVLYYTPCADVDSEAVGRLSVIQPAKGPMVVRILRKGFTKGLFNLAGMGRESPIESVAVQWAAPVAWIRT